MNSAVSVKRLPLHGCAPVPLASYLKALGILRLVSEQLPEANAKGHWERNHFVLTSNLSNEQVVEFFLERYAPTPIVVPWSGSDFFAVNWEQTEAGFRKLLENRKQKKRPTSHLIVEAVLASPGERLAPYRATLEATQHAMLRADVRSKADIEGSGKTQRDRKHLLLVALRNELPEEVIQWIDAATVIDTDGFAFNTLLGSGGGSDGNSHFSDNFMQALWMALPELALYFGDTVATASGQQFDTKAAIEAALFSNVLAGSLVKEFSPVLFDSSRVGGPNSTTGFSADAASNPWDFVLMLEGAMLFAGALARKYGNEVPPQATFPFTVTATPAGGANTIRSEAGGKELWLPLWSHAASFSEIQSLIAEGRMEVGKRTATQGIDVFRALASLGVPRGISAFQRFGIFRGRVGGDNYNTAVNLGRFRVQRNTPADLLATFEDWFTRAVSLRSGDRTPSGFINAVTRLEHAMVALCRSSTAASSTGIHAQEVLRALGACERAMAKSLRWAAENIRPVPILPSHWISAANTDTREFRLAASLAGLCGPLGSEWVTFRNHLEPVRIFKNSEQQWVQWDEDDSREVVWHDGDLTNALNAVLARRLVRTTRRAVLSDRSPFSASLDDISAFCEGLTDDRLLADLLWGLSLVDFSSSEVANHRPKWPEEHRAPSAFYALLKLCFANTQVYDVDVPIVPAIFRLAAVGRGQEASERAARRLTASDLYPAVRSISVSGKVAQRTAAALLFPIASPEPLARQVLLSPAQEPKLVTYNTL